MNPPDPAPVVKLVRAGIAAGLLLLAACGDGERQRASPYDAAGRPTRDLAAPRSPPNLVVVVIDTLRGDGLRLDGSKGRMPSLAALAQRGVAFTDATAPAPWTVPSMASLLTGLLPSAHGADDLNHVRVPSSVTMFAEVLRESYGYETAAFVGGPWYAWEEGMLQGFSRTNLTFALQGTDRVVGEWLDERDARRPFFMLLHTFEAHDPYGAENHPWPWPHDEQAPFSNVDVSTIKTPWEMTRYFFTDRLVTKDLSAHLGAGFLDTVVRYIHSGYRADPRPELRDELRDAYWRGVTWVDGLLGSTLALLEQRGVLENTLLVVTSDHGEAFAEHGILGHGRQLYDELVRVPLVMWGPEPFRGGRVIEGGVGLIDVLPTYFDMAGLTPIPDLRGRSALPLVRGETRGRVVISEERLYRENTGASNSAVRISARSARWKYIVTFDVRKGTIREELYDLGTDPSEQRDLAAPGGTLPADVPLDAVFCAAIEEIRDGLWGTAESTQARLHTPYGAGVAPLLTDRPAPCGSPRGD